MTQITNARHAWPERAGFHLERKNGYPDYTFLHFFGSVELLVGGERVVTRPHACILYAPGMPQWFYSRQPLTHDWIHFTDDPAVVPPGLECGRLYYPGSAGFLTELTRDIEFEFLSELPDGRRLMADKLDELLIRLGRSAAGTARPAVDDDVGERFRLLRGTVFSNLQSHWTVEQMASAVGLSKSRFFALYKGIYGNAPMDDLIRARVDSAKNALLFTNCSLAEIAEKLGYRNLTHFMRQFKALTGQTPGQYRSAGKQSETLP